MANFSFSSTPSLLFQLSRIRKVPRHCSLFSQTCGYHVPHSLDKYNSSPMQSATRSTANACRNMAKNQWRPYTNGSHAPSTPRHLLSIADLTPTEFATLVRNASSYKKTIKSDSMPERLTGALSGKTVAMMFSKRSTRTRVSTEGAVVKMGGHPMFLGKDDIQLGVNESLGYEIPSHIVELIQKAREGVQSPGNLTQTTVPEVAVKDADVIVTDTWISMGQETEKIKRLEAFKDFKVTSELAKRGGAKENWKFMHCLPRHPEEVSDEVFYSERSLVFPEAENRLWAAISALEAFVVNKGKIA
ncbi:ornithine carbamoyltransferase [Coccidioides immitis RMSCC 3703]|uniref:ornithine carbamoyltransferase n=1 Tax=Coccidioides immitis RMSCC 3703 TaxID=454286 RepID=A0A0J8QIV2_COCIT|nr:ornithine carbamoyltransferase [Coccidioides immitis RMSCC 3703]